MINDWFSCLFCFKSKMTQKNKINNIKNKAKHVYKGYQISPL